MLASSCANQIFLFFLFCIIGCTQYNNNNKIDWKRVHNYSSCQTPIITKGSDLIIAVADTTLTVTKDQFPLEIYDTKNTPVLKTLFNLKGKGKIDVSVLSRGAVYRYQLFMDADTLSDYFCYGHPDSMYNRQELVSKYKQDSIAMNTLMPNLLRLDRLLSDNAKSVYPPREIKIAYWTYRLKEIEAALQKGNRGFANSAGWSLRKFISTIDHGDDYYLFYMPENAKQINGLAPLIVIVPYVTNSHHFYSGGVISNHDRLVYLSKFAEKYGMAIIVPSARIFKWYNQTPVITKSIMEAMRDAENYYRFNKKHVFLYGDCSGGLFAFQTAIRRPDLFSAIGVEGPDLSPARLPVAGNPGLLSNNIYEMARNISDKPIAIFHSANDYVASVEHSLELIDVVKKLGGAVYYEDIDNLAKKVGSRESSESETMRNMFLFFSQQLQVPPPKEKKFSTYGFYNDTVYGVLVQKKLTLGKAFVSYQIKKGNQIHLTTNNVRKLLVDIKQMELPTSTNDIAFYFNGQKLSPGEREFKQTGRFVELTNPDADSKPFTKELDGPLNKVFLRRFAVVKPHRASVGANKMIAALDSIWLAEYRNYVIVIDETKADSARAKGVNLLYIIDNIKQMDQNILKQAGVELNENKLVCRGESFDMAELSGAFYNRDKKNVTDNMYLVTTSTEIPVEMIKSVTVFSGWHDFEIWDGTSALMQGNYE